MCIYGYMTINYGDYNLYKIIVELPSV